MSFRKYGSGKKKSFGKKYGSKYKYGVKFGRRGKRIKKYGVSRGGIRL